MSTPSTKDEIAAMLDEQAIAQQQADIAELEEVYALAQAKVDEAAVIDLKEFEDQANEMKKKLDRFSVT
jgi:hypothetical protein